MAKEIIVLYTIDFAADDLADRAELRVQILVVPAQFSKSFDEDRVVRHFISNFKLLSGVGESSTNRLLCHFWESELRQCSFSFINGVEAQVSEEVRFERWPICIIKIASSTYLLMVTWGVAFKFFW